jgi:Protein of unknown function (DUF4240)
MANISRINLSAVLNMTISVSEFWAAIESVNQSALDREEENLALQPLTQALELFSFAEIEGFEQYLAEVLFAIDGEDFFNASGETSGDAFLYCRCYVVAKGLQFYNAVLQQPALMPNKDCESLLYVARKAWAAKTGEEEDAWPFIASVDYETGCNAERWATRKSIELTAEQIAVQDEQRYQRALSKVVHAYRSGRFKYVEELLTPYKDRLSKRFSKMLQEAKSQAGSG